MSTVSKHSLLFVVLGLLFYIDPSIEDISSSDISTSGHEFVPVDSSLPPVLTYTAKKLLYCHMECNKRTDCRTFDYDATSKQCRLWDADTRTGSIVTSPSKPQSSVGTIRLSPSFYQNSHNQSCDKCVQSRYEVCDTNTNTCQCPSNTYWNGSMCLTQLLRNQTCSQANMCRSDLNLSCLPTCEFTYRCLPVPAMGVGLTVGGYCNGTIGNGSRQLQGPWSLHVSPNDGTLYVIDDGLKRLQAFPAFSRVGNTLLSSGVVDPTDVFVDDANTIYIVDRYLNSGTVLVQQGGTIVRSFPAAGQSINTCNLTGLYKAYGIAVDRSGNMYISLFNCDIVVKWARNATKGTLVAGQPDVKGATSNRLDQLRSLYLDEDRNALYVTDYINNRIQKFITGGNGTGTTAAGGRGAGTGLNQLNDPSGICVTRDGQTLYVADYGNHRVMKWTIGASQGSLVAGSATGVAGSTAQLLSSPGDVALDPTETYLYVSDYGNHRIQQFRIR